MHSLHPTVGGSTNGRTPRSVDARPASPSPAPARHELRFHDDDHGYARAVASFLAEGLRAGQAAIAIATAPHRAAIARELPMHGIAPAPELAAGRLILLDAREMLATFMAGRTPDPDRFAHAIGTVLDRCAAVVPDAPVYAHGEMVDLLCADGNVDGALQLEALWNDFAQHRRFHLLCTYATATFGGADDIGAYDAVCGQHSHVWPDEASARASDADRQRELARLQQRSRVLESELERRRRIEDELRAALDATQRAEEAVRRHERELTEILDSAADAIHWVGADGRILWANRAELAMLGYEAHEYVGRPVADIHVDAEVVASFLDRLGRDDTLRDEPARLRCKDGAIRHVLVNSRVLWRDGAFAHTCCFTRDVTEQQLAAAERERLLEREQRARAEAETANRAKTDFLGVMSHELRTPLNAIGGYAQLLEMGVRGPVTDEQREDLRRLRQASQHLMGLVTDVLNFTRIEARRVDFDLQDLMLGDVVAGLEPLLLPQFAAKGVRYAPDACAAPAACSRHRVRADPEKLRQVLLNLISNAVKFTEPGGLVALECGCDETCDESNDEAGDVVRLRVRDTGRGIPVDQLDRIFEPFVQVDRRATHASQQGIGLGLAISRELVRGMGGDLRAESALGQGCTFTVSLPGADAR